MAQYRYTGPGPDVDPASGAIVHPGDVWEFPEEPAFGRWELIEAEGSEKPSEASQGATQASTSEDSGTPPTGEPDASSHKEA